MKKIFGIVYVSLLLFCQALQAQVTGEVIAMDPQSGSHNYFGVKVTLSQTYGHNVTVTGYICDEGNGFNANHPFTLTVLAGELTAETAANFYETDPTASAAIYNLGIIYGYAGVSITYEPGDCILKFNSYSDIIAVINQLNADDEAYNDDYDDQYPNLTEDQLDEMDEQNNFDDVKTFRDFESLFGGFCSKRSQIEAIENTWLANNFTGTDPFDIDQTLEEAENTIFNSNYALKIGNDFYQLTVTGFFKNGILLDIGGTALMQKYPNNENFETTISSINSGPFQNQEFLIPSYAFNDHFILTDCKSNKKSKREELFDNDTKKLRFKVGINSVWFGSNVKAKAVSFKKNNGNWKRARTKMAVSLGGTVYEGDCLGSFSFNQRKPVNGFDKRKRLKYSRRSPSVVPSLETNWKTYSGLIGGSLEAPNLNFSGSLLLTF